MKQNEESDSDIALSDPVESRMEIDSDYDEKTTRTGCSFIFFSFL